MLAAKITEKESEREKGIKAIIYLQASAGITETPEEAGKDWGTFSKAEQEQTMIFYRMMKANEK